MSDKPRVEQPRDFWVLTVGQGLAYVAAALILIITSFLIEDLTQSATWVAAYAAAGGLAFVMGQFVTNNIVNKLQPFRTIMLVYLLLALFAGLVAALFTLERLSAETLVVYAFVTGIIYSFASPVAWQILLKAVSGHDALVRAQGIYSGVKAGMGIAGSIVATLLLAWGEYALGLFLGAGLAFLVVPIAFTLRKVEVAPSQGSFKPVKGFKAAYRIPGARWLLAFTVGIGLIAAPLAELFPVLSNWLESGVAEYLGLLFLAYYIGSTLQAIVIVRVEQFGTRSIVFASSLSLGGLMLLLALTRNPWLSLAIIAVYGLALGIVRSMFASTISAISAPETHGPFVSLYTLQYMFASSIVGVLIWGRLVDSFGLQPVLLGAGACMAIVALAGAWRFPKQRPDTEAINEPNVTAFPIDG